MPISDWGVGPFCVPITRSAVPEKNPKKRPNIDQGASIIGPGWVVREKVQDHSACFGRDKTCAVAVFTRKCDFIAVPLRVGQVISRCGNSIVVSLFQFLGDHQILPTVTVAFKRMLNVTLSDGLTNLPTLSNLEREPQCAW